MANGDGWIQNFEQREMMEEQEDLNLRSQKSSSPWAQMGSASKKQVEQMPAELKAAQTKLLDQQQQGIEQLQGRLDQIKQEPSNANIAPLLALSDAWTGSKFLQTYKPQATEEKRQAQINKLENELQKRKGDLTKAQISYMKSLMRPTGDAKQDAINQRFIKSKQLQMENQMREDLAKNLIEPMNTRAEQFKNIDDYLATNDYQQVWATLSQFARGISGEKGVLTDKDITRVMPANIYGTAGFIRSYFSKTPSADMPPEWTSKLRELVKIAKRNAADVYGQALKTKKGLYDVKGSAYSDLMKEGSAGQGLFDVANKHLEVFKGGERPGEVLKKEMQAGGLTPEQEKRRQELLLKAGAQ